MIIVAVVDRPRRIVAYNIEMLSSRRVWTGSIIIFESDTPHFMVKIREESVLRNGFLNLYIRANMK